MSHIQYQAGVCRRPRGTGPARHWPSWPNLPLDNGTACRHYPLTIYFTIPPPLTGNISPIHLRVVHFNPSGVSPKHPIPLSKAMSVKTVSLTPFSDQKPGTCVQPAPPSTLCATRKLTIEQIWSEEKSRCFPTASLQRIICH
jgi:hypothetical protein